MIIAELETKVSKKYKEIFIEEGITQSNLKLIMDLV